MMTTTARPPARSVSVSRRATALLAILVGFGVAGVAWAAAASGEEPTKAVVALDPQGAAAGSVDAGNTCSQVKDAIQQHLDTKPGTPIPLKVPLLELGPANIGTAAQQAEITFNCGGDNNRYEIRFKGPFAVAHVTVAMDLKLTWTNATAAVPEVTLDLDATGEEDEIFSVPDVVGLVRGLFPALQADTEELGKLTLRGVRAHFATAQGDLAFDLSATSTLVPPARPEPDPDGPVSDNADDPVSDPVDVGYLLSVTKPNGFPPVMLAAISFRNADHTQERFNLAHVMRGSVGVLVSDLELPNMWMAMVQPKTAKLTVADLRPVAKEFFPTDLDDVPTEFRFDGKLTIGADVNLDALGTTMKKVFGWQDGAKANLVGKLGFDFGTLTDGKTQHFDLNDVDIDITLPPLSPGADSPLPNWIALEEASLHVGWTQEEDAVTVVAKSKARLTPHDLDVSVDTTTTFKGWVDDQNRRHKTFKLTSLATVEKWESPLGLSWLDIDSVGVEVELTHRNEQIQTIDAVLTGNFKIGGKTFDARLSLGTTTQDWKATVALELRDSVSLAEVLGLFGSFDLPKEFHNLTIGGADPKPPVRLTAHVESTGGATSVSVAINAPATVKIAEKNQDLNFLFAIEFPAGKDPVLTVGGRTGGSEVRITDVVGEALPPSLKTALENPNHELAKFNFTVPTIGVVYTSTAIAKAHTDLGPEEHEFFRWVHGCGDDADGKPKPGCKYDVKLSPGVHLLTGVQMPKGGDGKPVASDLLKALWLWDDTPALAPQGGDAQLASMSSMSTTSDVPPPPEVLFRASIKFGEDSPKDLSFSGVELGLALPINPPESVRPDWFNAAELSLMFGMDGTTTKIELAGSLGVQLRDDTVPVSTSATKPDVCTRSWVLVRHGGAERACYDLLTVRVLTQVELGSTGGKVTIGGDLLTAPGVGWQQPLGVPFLRIDAAKIRLSAIIEPTGPRFEIGVLAAGALFDKDFSGSLLVGFKPVPNPPFVIPTFGGLRLSSQAGVEMADVIALYDAIRTQSQSLLLAQGQNAPANLTSMATLPALDPKLLEELPNISLRNLELMVGVADAPDLCITPGFVIAGELYLNAARLTVAPPAPPGGCTTQSNVNPADCLVTPSCFAAVNVSAGSNGIVATGAMGRFELGALRWEDALFDLRLTPSQQRLQVKGGAGIEGIARGSVDLRLGSDGVAFVGDVELAPGLVGSQGSAFRAMVEGEVSANLKSFDFSDPAKLLALQPNLHVVLQADFEAAMRQVTDPVFTRLRSTVLVLDAVTKQLVDSGDPLQVVLDLPATLRSVGQPVPKWLDDLIAEINKGVNLMREHGITVPNLDTLLTTQITLPGIPGTWIPGQRTCFYTLFGVNTWLPGTVVDGVCYSVVPDPDRWWGDKNGRPGIWVDRTCWAIELVLEGTVTSDGRCWRLAPTVLPSLCELVVRPLGILPAGAACNYASVRDHLVYPALNGALTAFGMPQGVTLTQALDTLVGVVNGGLPPVSLPCVDFRLTTAGPPGEHGIRLRIDSRVFSNQLRLDLGWDFAKPPASEASRLAAELMRQLFVSAPNVHCEPIGQTTVAGGAGGAGTAPSLTGFTLSVDKTAIKAGQGITLRGVVDSSIAGSTAAVVNWGDGTTAQHTVAQLRAGIAKTYLDDHPSSGTAADLMPIAVTVLERTERIGVTVENNPPTDLVIDVPARVDEGQQFTLQGTFTDPDPDTHTVVVDWGDGDPVEIPLAKGARSFSVPHTYLDDDPTGTPYDLKRLRVSVVDDDTGEVAVKGRVTVDNVAPSDVTITPVLEPDDRIEEGDLVTYRIDFVDPGVLDTHLVTVDWGDGTPATNVALTGGERSAEVTHLFLDDDPTGTPHDDVTVTVTVTDDDTGTATTTRALTVHNVEPDVTLSLDRVSIDEGEEVTATVSFTDPGVLDTHTVTIDWGYDGFAPTVIGDVPGGLLDKEVVATKRYGDNGTFTVTATVVDDDTGRGVATQELVVGNVDPTAAIDTGAPAPGSPSQVEGTSVVLADGPADDGVIDTPTFLTRAGLRTWFRARASDPGSDDLTFTWTWDRSGRFGLAPRTTTYRVDPDRDDPLPSPEHDPRVDVVDRQDHIWAQACLYHVGLEVVDDDAGRDERDTWVVVTGTDHRVRNAGWWDSQYNLERNRNRNDLDPVTLECYVEISRHMSAMFSTLRSIGTFEDVRSVLLQASMNADEDKLDRQILTTWFNLAHGSLGWFQDVRTPEGRQPLLAALRRAEAVWLDPNAPRAQRIAWKDALERING